MNEAAAAIFLRPRARIAERSQANQQMLYAQRINEQSAKQNLAENQQQRSILEAQYARMADAPFLEASKRELHAQFEDMEKRISTKIQKDFGGNVNEYVNAIGQTDQMRNYKDFVTSDAYSRAVSSKASYVQWQDDLSKGKMARLNPNGHTMEHEFQLFDSGAKNVLGYNGGYKPASKYVEQLEKKRGPNYFGTPEQNIASRESVMTELVAELGNDRDAIDQYLQSGLDKKRIYHKTADPMDMLKLNHTMQVDYAKMANDRARLKLAQNEDGRRSMEMKMANQQVDMFAFWGRNNRKSADIGWNYDGDERRKFNGKYPQIVGFPIVQNATIPKAVVSATGGTGTWIEGKDRPDGAGVYQYAEGKKAKTAEGTDIRIRGFSPEGIETVFDENGRATMYATGVGYVDERDAESAGVAKWWSPSHQQVFGGSGVENLTSKIGSWGSALINGGEKAKYKMGKVMVPINDPNALDKTVLNKEGLPGIKTNDMINSSENAANNAIYNRGRSIQYNQNSLTGDL